MQTRREIICEANKGCNKLSKKEKGMKLNSIVAVTGYSRDYASRLLSLLGKRVYVKDGSVRPCKLVANMRKKRSKMKKCDNDLNMLQ
jgi:hypothetical protein